MGLFWNVICPTIATIAVNIRSVTPFRAVLRCRAQGSLGEMNPIPWAVSLTIAMFL